jgi:hypothetical protein
MLDDAAVDEILKSLRETIAWCADRVNTEEPETCLRSEELRPPPADTVYDSIGGTMSRVDTVVNKRRAALDRTAEKDVRPGDLRSGDLIALDVDWQDAGGASTVASGYFDWNDTPPWDTWSPLSAATAMKDVITFFRGFRLRSYR